MSHIGIRLRISIPGAGPVVEADSDMLHYIAKMGLPGPCLPACLPGCQEHGWFDLLTGGGELAGPVPLTGAMLTIEIKPVELDEPPADEDLADDERCSCCCSNCSGCLG